MAVEVASTSYDEDTRKDVERKLDNGDSDTQD